MSIMSGESEVEGREPTRSVRNLRWYVPMGRPGECGWHGATGGRACARAKRSCSCPGHSNSRPNAGLESEGGVGGRKGGGGGGRKERSTRKRRGREARASLGNCRNEASSYAALNLYASSAAATPATPPAAATSAATSVTAFLERHETNIVLAFARGRGVFGARHGCHFG